MKGLEKLNSETSKKAYSSKMVSATGNKLTKHVQAGFEAQALVSSSCVNSKPYALVG